MVYRQPATQSEPHQRKRAAFLALRAWPPELGDNTALTGRLSLGNTRITFRKKHHLKNWLPILTAGLTTKTAQCGPIPDLFWAKLRPRLW